LIIVDEREGIFNDWITHEYLEGVLSGDKAEHWADIAKLYELRVVITNENCDYLVNFDFDQRPPKDRVPPPRRVPDRLQHDGPPMAAVVTRSIC
jgi:hypothetical protein